METYEMILDCSQALECHFDSLFNDPQAILEDFRLSGGEAGAELGLSL
jgi:hypothetical protein